MLSLLITLILAQEAISENPSLGLDLLNVIGAPQDTRAKQILQSLVETDRKVLKDSDTVVGGKDGISPLQAPIPQIPVPVGKPGPKVIAVPKVKPLLIPKMAPVKVPALGIDHFHSMKKFAAVKVLPKLLIPKVKALPLAIKKPQIHTLKPIVHVVHKPVPVFHKVPVPKKVIIPKFFPVFKPIPIPKVVPLPFKVPVVKTIPKFVKVPKAIPIPKLVPVKKIIPVGIPVPVPKIHKFPVLKPVPFLKPFNIPIPIKVPKFVPFPVKKVVKVPKPFFVPVKIPVVTKSVVKTPIVMPVPHFYKHY